MKSNYYRNALLNHVFRAASWPTLPSDLHIALFTSANDVTGGGTEVSGGSYARLAVTRNTSNWASSSAGATDNLGLLSWPTATGNWGKVIDFALTDASSSGNQLIFAPLTIGAWLPFTALTTDVITVPGSSLADGDAVRLLPVLGGTLPSGVSAGTEYFIRDTSSGTHKLAAAAGGSAIDLTAVGAGYIAKSGAKTVSTNDTFTMPIGNLDILES